MDSTTSAQPPKRANKRVLQLFFYGIFTWVRDIAQGHPDWCFPLAFVLAFGESLAGVSLIVPGTVLLITLGGVIGASHIPLLPAWAGAAAGAIAGDWISWWIGFHYHHRIVHIVWFKRFEPQIEKALHFFHRWGAVAVFVGRFTGPLRASVPLVAGMSELEFWPFMIANAMSAFAWAFVLLAPGAAFLREFVP